MKHQAAYCGGDGDLETVEDTCLSITYRCLKCGTQWSKKKRRPAALTDDQCSWHMTMRCNAHPGKPNASW